MPVIPPIHVEPSAATMRRAILQKLMEQYPGTFTEAFNEVCDELRVKNPDDHYQEAEMTWIRNATRCLKEHKDGL